MQRVVLIVVSRLGLLPRKLDEGGPLPLQAPNDGMQKTIQFHFSTANIPEGAKVVPTAPAVMQKDKDGDKKCVPVPFVLELHYGGPGYSALGARITAAWVRVNFCNFSERASEAMNCVLRLQLGLVVGLGRPDIQEE